MARQSSGLARLGWAMALALLLSLAAPVQAAIERLDILHREPFAAGASFGQAGAYEIVRGRLHYALDPALPANRAIVDLAQAPRDAQGRVTFAGDFVLLRPRDLARGNHRLLYEVGNRGTLGLLGLFNDAPWSNLPTSLADAGNGFLLRQGYSLLWTAWNWDVLPGEGRLQIALPVARGPDGPITGPVVAEFVLDQPTMTAPFMWGNSRGYPPLDLAEPAAELSVRAEPTAPRQVLPRASWRFARLEAGRPVPDPGQVWLADGFQPGLIYEVRYTAADPKVVGLGLAAIRDSLAFFRFAARAAGGAANPLAPAGQPDPTSVLVFGNSQSGRVIQHMLWQGFARDEAGRPVFDGAFIHVAGGGKGSFNHRFAQTTRHPSEFEDQQYPVDILPFTTTPATDPITGERADLLAKARAAGPLPKLVYTTTSTEYWTRSASLVQTDPAGQQDQPLDPAARLYFIAGAQHGTWQWPSPGPYRACTNPLDQRPVLRALLMALADWVETGRLPPASRYPRLGTGELGSVADYRAAFPALPGVSLPGGNLAPPRLDLGPRFARLGIADRQPAAFGPAFVTRVPLPDRDGIDRGGIRLPAIVWPLGTYAGWNLRRPEVGASHHLARWSGSFWPFARTAAERQANGDPRPDLAARYRSRADYEARIGTAATALAAERFLLADEVPALQAAAGDFYERVLRRGADPEDCGYTLAP